MQIRNSCAVLITCALLLFAGSAAAQTTLADIEEALQKNLDRIVFKSFTVASKRQEDDGIWLCGRMLALSYPAGVPTYLEFDFVAQIFPKPMPLGGPSSWITLAGPGTSSLNQERYDKYCK